MIPTYFDTTYNQQRLMNIITSFITNPKATVLMQPRQTAFNHPTIDTQSTAITCSTFRQDRNNTFFTNYFTMRFRILAAIALHRIRSFARTSNFASNRRNCFNQRQQLCNIVAVGTSQFHRQWNAIGVRNQMVFRAVFAAICGIWASFRPPKTARTEAESTTAREKSILSTFLSLLSRVLCILSQTPAFCQLRRRRQQVQRLP